MEKMSLILRKCKSLRQLGRSSSYSSLRSRSTREHDNYDSNSGGAGDDEVVVVLVGKSRRPYLISSKHLSHPLLIAVIDRSSKRSNAAAVAAAAVAAAAGAAAAAAAAVVKEEKIHVKCEVVLFDHLLWMLENVDLDVIADDEAALEELAQLYAC